MNTLKILTRAAAASAAIAALALVLAPAPAAADFVINDDLIVDGSACIGFDCVNGESFGFDTLRLKENNLRIRAFDTSNTASFPTFDWQILFNETSNGGLNKFAIEDVDSARIPFTIEGGSDANSIYVDTGGRIGFGTNTPVVELHVKDGDTPTLRLEQDGSSGFTPQTWDVAGNETNFFIRDVTNGSRLPFRIRPGAETSSIDIQGNGDVNFQGDSAGDLRLTLRSGTAADDFAEFTFTEGSTNQWGFGRFGADDSFYIFNYQNPPNQYAMYVQGSTNHIGLNCRTNTDHDLTINSGSASCTSGTFSQIDAGELQFTNTSSRTMKENLQPVMVDGLLDKIVSAEVYTYDYIEGPKDAIGIMAEDFHPIFGRGSDKMLSGHEMQMALWLAVQELTAQNRELTARLAALEGKR